MSAKVDQTAVVETHRVQNASSTSSANSTKISMFKGKAGFVIPKNKFSGSLVPIFKGGKKSATTDASSEGDSKQVQRKTKWGPDLTQDTAVRRGRALAYQTRVDQITQQLKLGSLSGDNQNSTSAGDVPDGELATMQIDYEKLHSLELERRELIGELLKLNPSYRAPSGYQPIVREATVPIPVKEHPGYNFVALIYGPDGDTQQRLEKETGTKMQVCGTKSETGEKVAITASDGSEILSSCDEVCVRISADTYEKVDAAASLIELLLSSVPGQSTASKTSTSESGDDAKVQYMATAVSTPMASQEQLQTVVGPTSTPSPGPFQAYPGSWFPAGQPNHPSSMAFPFNPSPPNQVFGSRPSAPYGFGSSPQNTPVLPPRMIHPPPVRAMQGPFMPPPYPLGQTGPPPRNISSPTPPSPLAGHQPTAAGSPRVLPPQSASSLGWGVPHSMASQYVASSPAPPPSVTPQPFPSPQVGPALASQIRSSVGQPVQPFTPPGPLLRPPAQSPLPQTSASHGPQPGLRAPAPGPLNVPSFTPLKPMGSSAPRPPMPGPNDFTFQPHRPPQGPPSQRPPPPMQLSSAKSSQVPTFRPALQNTGPQQNFSRPPMGNQMGPHPGQFRPPSPNPHMGPPRNHGPVPHMSNAAGPFPPRVGHPTFGNQQSFPGPPLGRPGGLFGANLHSSPSGRPQIYDPFSPTSASAPRPQGSNIAGNRKQESDPEYEDLMASVGVK